MNYRRNFRVAVLLDGPPAREHEVVEVYHNKRGLIKGYLFGYTNFDDVLTNKPLEFLVIDEQSFVTYHGTDRRIAEMVSDRELRGVSSVETLPFFIRRAGEAYAPW